MMAEYSLLENASRLPFGSTELGLDPFSSKELHHRYRRREGSEVSFGQPLSNVWTGCLFIADYVGRILGDPLWPDWVTTEATPPRMLLDKFHLLAFAVWWNWRDVKRGDQKETARITAVDEPATKTKQCERYKGDVERALQKRSEMTSELSGARG